MLRETISIHGRFTFDPSTKAFAPPIYQNVAYEFGSADHGAALFYDALKLVKQLVNIGVTRTLCRHSASTTHRQMTPPNSVGQAYTSKRSGSASDSNMRRTSLKTSSLRMRPRASTGLLSIPNAVLRTLCV